MNTEIKNIQEGEKNYNFVQISRGYLKNWRALIRKNPLSAEILFQKKSKEKLTYVPIVEKNEIVLTGNEKLDPPDQLDLNLE